MLSISSYVTGFAFLHWGHWPVGILDCQQFSAPKFVAVVPAWHGTDIWNCLPIGICVNLLDASWCLNKIPRLVSLTLFLSVRIVSFNLGCVANGRIRSHQSNPKEDAGFWQHGMCDRYISLSMGVCVCAHGACPIYTKEMWPLKCLTLLRCCFFHYPLAPITDCGYSKAGVRYGGRFNDRYTM